MKLKHQKQRRQSKAGTWYRRSLSEVTRGDLAGYAGLWPQDLHFHCHSLSEGFIDLFILIRFLSRA